MLDCQSTGASPRHGHLLEVGWATVRGRDDDAPKVHSRLVALPDGAELPPAIARLTGLTQDDLVDAAAPSDVWQELATLAAAMPTVVHFARFETPFLRQLQDEHGGGGASAFDIVCTHEIARRCLPGLPRRGLRALAGYFGLQCGELKRSAGHVTATATVWRELVAALRREHDVRTLEDLKQWLADTPAPRGKARDYPMSRARRLSLPEGPGIYRFQDSAGHVLYVGKAISLKRRVCSYFQKVSGVPERTLELLTQVKNVDIEVTESALEAAVLECDQIKDLRPPYNRALRRRGREVWYADPSWSRVADRSSPETPVGPWLDARLPLGLSAIASVLGDDATVSPPPTIPMWGRAADLPAEVFAAGLAELGAELCARTQVTPSDRASLLRAAHALGPVVEEADEADEEPDDDETETTETWTAADVTERLRELVIRTAAARRRAAWLRRLANATVEFHERVPRPRHRVLTLRDGEIVSASDVALGRRAPVADPACHVPPAIDLRTYDRLRVLTTELRRLVASNLPVTVYVNRQALTGDRLARTLTWV